MPEMYYSMILNYNGKDDRMCGSMFTVENSQSNEFIAVVNVKSKLK